jgi:alkyl sulfatase BDS1-like metallo-beta-lactamase superfamily hydrolase
LGAPTLQGDAPRRAQRAARTALALLGVALAACGRGAEKPPAPAPGSADAPHIVPELAEHTREFDKRIYKVTDQVYSAVGYQLANTILVIGPDGLVIFDVGGSLDQGREILAEFRKISTLPIRAIVYSHFHPDHITAAKAWASEEDVASGRVEVIAHETLVRNVANQGVRIGPILGIRSAYSFGALLPAADVEGMNGGIGPRLEGTGAGAATFLRPTRSVGERLETTLAGLRAEFVHVPSEAPDEIALWLPESRVLLSAEVIQGPTFPNLHTLRGTSFRSPVDWYQSIDVLRGFHADHLVPSHGPPVSGAQRVEDVLRNCRDAIQYVHDQTIRRMNAGATPDELAEEVVLPPHLAGIKPWLREYYGTVKHSVREIYEGYLGWFQGDPVRLDPVPPAEAARRRVALMGGRDRVLAEAQRVLDAGDPQWAAELASELVKVDREDMDARRVEARAFRRLGYAQLNINWRNWYLMSAQELEGTLDGQKLAERIARAFSSPDLLAALPTRTFFEGMTVRLRAEKVLDEHLTAGFEFPDTGESFALEVRRGVAQLHDPMPAECDVVLSMQRPFLERVVQGQVGLLELIGSGQIHLKKGSALDALRFLGWFERPSPRAVALTLR